MSKSTNPGKSTKGTYIFHFASPEENNFSLQRNMIYESLNKASESQKQSFKTSLKSIENMLDRVAVRRLTIVATESDDNKMFNIGYAACSFGDRFQKSKGVQIALNRQANKKTVIKVKIEDENVIKGLRTAVEEIAKDIFAELKIKKENLLNNRMEKVQMQSLMRQGENYILDQIFSPKKEENKIVVDEFYAEAIQRQLAENKNGDSSEVIEEKSE